MPGFRYATLFEAPTVRSLSQRLRMNKPVQEVFPVQTLKKGTGVPLFCIHPGGGVSWPYQALGGYLDCPIIGIQQIQQDEEAEPRSIRDMAKNYADRIQGAYPSGPYKLLGWSFGGVVAHEVAIELQRRGGAVARLILLDAQPGIDGNAAPPGRKRIAKDSLSHDKMEELVRELGVVEYAQDNQLLDLIVQNVNSSVLLYRAHEAGIFDGDIIIFSAARDEGDRSSFLQQSWRPYVAGDITVHSIDCTHQEMMTTASLSIYGNQLRRLIGREDQ